MTSVDRRKDGLRWSAVAAVLLCFAGAAWWRHAARPGEVTITGETMGTTYTVKLVTAAGAGERDALAALVRDTLEDVNARMSTYRDDSELSEFNRHAGTEPVSISEELAAVFAVALEVSERSGGAFDVTVGPLVNAWGFGPDEAAEGPDDAELEALRARVGYTLLDLAPREALGRLREDPVRPPGEGPAGGYTLAKARPDVYCDLSAIAKGYGVERAARALEERGVADFMVEVGGEVQTKGVNIHGQAWRMAIERPVSEVRAIERVVPLSGLGLATSGDYRNFYERDGQRYSHTIDPRTGRPMQSALASASVVHASCTWADAWATALMASGPERAQALAEANGLAVLLISHGPAGEFDETETPGFAALAQ